MSTPAPTPVAPASDKLIDRLPRPLRHLFELIGIASALVTLLGWIASTFSLIAKMTFWGVAWTALVSWIAHVAPGLAAIARWIGTNTHWLVDQYRAFFYPIFDRLFEWLPFEVPPIAIDVISIVFFGIFGAARLMRIVEQHPDDADRALSIALRGGILFPIVLVQILPFWLLVILSERVSSLNDFLSNVGGWLEDKIGLYWSRTIMAATVGLPFLCAFPLAIFLIDWIYVTFVI